jgi:hypothetical protein
MNSTTSKRHAGTLRNWNIPFQLKKRNTYQNGIDNLAQPSWPGHWPKLVTRMAEARMRELFTHAMHSGKVIKITFSLYLCNYKWKGAGSLPGRRNEDDDEGVVAGCSPLFFIFWFVSVRSRPV